MQSTNLNLKLTDVNGSNLVSKNSKMSLETYLKTRLYESVPVETKKIKLRKKILKFLNTVIICLCLKIIIT